MSDELEHIWSRVQAELALAVDEPTYRIWLEPLRAVDLAGSRLLIEAPPHACRWVEDRFGRLLRASAALILGADVVLALTSANTVEERGGGDPPTAHWSSPQHRATAASPQTHPGPRTTGDELLPHTGPLGNPKLTFEQFVIGDCNRLAHAAALTVAEMPAHTYNPLFICGPPGVGKTHLLNSIASLLLAHNPGLTVRCTTGESFTNEFLTALSAGHTQDFKDRFRHIDVLLMDDVQFLERKTRTEEEFFHTFNALHDSGRQIVLTSDRPPLDLQALEERLRERFQAGLVADIAPPDLATRLTVLRKRAQHDHIELEGNAALEAIAERVHTNVRALEGALIRVVAFSSLTGRTLTPELAHEVLDRLYPRTSAAIRGARSIEEIQAAACSHFGLTREELISPARTLRIAWPRQMAMYLARELTSESLPAIGRQFGGRDHTTVMHACRRTSARIASEDASRRAVENLLQILDSAP